MGADSQNEDDTVSRSPSRTICQAALSRTFRNWGFLAPFMGADWGNTGTEKRGSMAVLTENSGKSLCSELEELAECSLNTLASPLCEVGLYL